VGIVSRWCVCMKPFLTCTHPATHSERPRQALQPRSTSDAQAYRALGPCLLALLRPRPRSFATSAVPPLGVGRLHRPAMVARDFHQPRRVPRTPRTGVGGRVGPEGRLLCDGESGQDGAVMDHG
jgi:hypothetical protein